MGWLALALGACSTPPRPSPTVAALPVASDPSAQLPRPALGPTMDTNDARAYYARAEPLVRLGIKLDTADMALYWASRLDPAWANPLYARALVVLRALQADQVSALFQHGSTRGISLTPQQEQLVDSLMQLAWAHDPFMFTDLDAFLLPPAGLVEREDPGLAGWRAYKQSDFSRAESLFAVALQRYPDRVPFRVYRAQTLVRLGQWDSAAIELATARDTVRAWATKQDFLLLPSLEMFDYAIGIIRVNQDNLASAREAFGRALSENLGFYWAHARMAGVNLRLGDTMSAITELESAVQIEPRDPALRLYHGYMLRMARRDREATDEFLEALRLDPYYAQPHIQLALVCQIEGDSDAVVEHYRRYLALAARQDPDRPGVLRALADLAAVRGARDTPSPPTHDQCGSGAGG